MRIRGSAGGGGGPGGCRPPGSRPPPPGPRPPPPAPRTAPHAPPPEPRAPRMPTYAYNAVDPTGKRTRGHAQAASTGALTRSLEERGLFVLDVAESSSDAAAGRRGFRIGRRREVLEVTRPLAALLPVGMPLAQALNAATGVASGDVKAALVEVR